MRWITHIILLAVCVSNTHAISFESGQEHLDPALEHLMATLQQRAQKTGFVAPQVPYSALYFPKPATRQAVLYNNIGSPTVIRSSDIPYTISSPGRYILVENSFYFPISATPAITIASSGVTLDLLYSSLVQVNTLSSVTGIQVQSGLQGIFISGGGISGFSQSGIAIQSGVSTFNILNLAISNCGNRALELVGTTASPISQGGLTNLILVTSATLSTGDSLLTLSNCNDMSINGCILGNYGSSAVTGTLTGMHMVNCSRLLVVNTLINNAIALRHTRGISLENAQGNTFSNLLLKDFEASGGGSTCHGVELELTSTTNTFDNVQVSNMTAQLLSECYLTSTGCDNNFFSNCRALYSNARATTGRCIGFRAVSNFRNVYDNCISVSMVANTSTVTPYGAAGFIADTATALFWNTCTSANHSSATNAVGFLSIGNGNQTFGVNCIAFRNTHGFDQQGTFANNAYTSNISAKNSTLQYAAGWSAGANQTVASTAINTLTQPWQNIGIN